MLPVCSQMGEQKKRGKQQKEKGKLLVEKDGRFIRQDQNPTV